MRNKNGQGIVQALVGVALLGICATVFASLMHSQNRQIKYLEAKQETLDLKNALFRILGEEMTFCPIAKSNLGDLVFSANDTPSLPIHKIFDQKKAVYLDDATGLPPPTPINIKSMRLDILQGTGDSYVGDLVIDIEIKNSSFAIKPLAMKGLAIRTKSLPKDPSQKRIISCPSSGQLSGALRLFAIHDLMSSNLTLAPGKYLINVYMEASPTNPAADYSYMLSIDFNKSSISKLGIADTGDSDGLGQKRKTSGQLRYLNVTTSGILSYSEIENVYSGKGIGSMTLHSLTAEVYQID